MLSLSRVVRMSLGTTALAGLLLCGGGSAPTFTQAAAPRATVRLASAGLASVTGVWTFATNDTGDNLARFTLLLRQRGALVTGFDTGGEPVYGRITGSTLSFTVYGVSSEDDYGGQGTLGPGGRLLSGSFWDGYGFTGVFSAVKLLSAG
jgi:hypothetical protein